MSKPTFLTTSAFSDKMLGMDLHLMHVEPIEALCDLRNQYKIEILWEMQIALEKENPGQRTKKVPTYQRSWTVPYRDWREISKMQEVLVGPI